MNRDIRFLAQQNGVRLWEIADAVGMTDGNFSRKLRHELSGDQKDHIFRVIASIAAEHEVQSRDRMDRLAEKKATDNV